VSNPQDGSSTDLDHDLRGLARVIRRTKGRRQTLQLGAVVEEFDAWLADDRQWRYGQFQHWKSLINDLLGCLAFVASLSSPPFQDELSNLIEDLKRLRGELGASGEIPDEALRRQLQRVSKIVGAGVDVELLRVGVERVMEWAGTKPQRAEDSMCVLRDLAELCGHDSDRLFDEVDGILTDNAWQIAAFRGEKPPATPQDVAGASAEERLALAVKAIGQVPPPADGVVWLEYLQATLGWPPILKLGESVSLYNHDFLRSMVHQAPNDTRLPDDLRQVGGDDPDLLWFDAHDPVQAVRADHRVNGDPRVFLRVDLPAMGRAQRLAEAREIAEFLVAYGGMGDDNPDLWVLGDSYFVRGWQMTTGATFVNEQQARLQFPADGTALRLGRSADELGRHLPFRDPQLRLAGRLLVWLRHANSTSAAAQVVLCDRVIEQVCGWAGFTKPATFTDAVLKPSWIYTRIVNAVQNSYRQLRYSPVGRHELWSAIELNEPHPPHAPHNYFGSTNLKAILENLDKLIAITPPNPDTSLGLIRLRDHLANGAAARAWLDDVKDEFDHRNGRLRRTRNALMHGGPIVMPIVDHVSPFSLALATHAIGMAVELLLDDRDLVDGFVDRQNNLRRCFALLGEGVAPTEALFWDGSHT
jgi:hypothetical protein